ncbi:MAG: PD-(D/E)XK nuclease family protein [Acidobacteria bacterium]|nr:PD-(D/E)XK nuclease family protein [Acidobacteriota bacterium]
MTDLKNEFRWSVSRYRHFQECRRLFYLNHYAHWGGWELNADEFAKTCYRLTKMRNLDTWAGEIVHEGICETLHKVRLNQPVSLAAMTAEAIQKLRVGWTQSKNEEWRLDPKRRLNLFEHYYNRQIPRERTDEIKQRVAQCLENFWHSPTFQFIQQVGADQWKCLEEFQSFELANFTVSLRIDFALQYNGLLYIYDWKTGQQDGEDLMQLVCYALYGMKTWRFAVDRIKIILAYLRQNVFVEHVPTPEEIIEAKDRILDGCYQMVSSLTDPEANVASIDNFPATLDRWKCTRCFFWEACYGNRQIEQ